MKVLKLCAVLVSLSLAACGGGSSSTSGSTTPKTAESDPSCPVAVAGTSVSVEDSATGAALVFVTTGDVADLRRRVASMASMHNEHHAAMGAMPDGKDAGGGHEGHDISGHAGHDMSGHDMSGHDMSGGNAADDHAGHDMSGSAGHAGHDMGGGQHAGHAGGMIGVHSKATAADIEGGAKIDFVVGQDDVARIQSELRMHAQHFASGTCNMGKS